MAGNSQEKNSDKVSDLLSGNPASNFEFLSFHNVCKLSALNGAFDTIHYCIDSKLLWNYTLGEAVPSLHAVLCSAGLLVSGMPVPLFVIPYRRDASTNSGTCAGGNHSCSSQSGDAWEIIQSGDAWDIILVKLS